MKKMTLTLVLLLFCLAPVIFAQPVTPGESPSEFYYHNVTIERVYPYRLGYVVMYRGSQHQIHQAYIPMEWFNTGPASRAEIIVLRAGREWPSMTVYYHRGEFSHVRLRLRDRAHETWGLVRPGVNLDEYFQGVEEIRLQF